LSSESVADLKQADASGDKMKPTVLVCQDLRAFPARAEL
jgi:hypothetical protein